MTQPDSDLAARLLAARAAGDHCPEWLPGAIDLEQALDLQLAVLDARLQASATVGGWKVGLTSQASRNMLGADERPFGFVLADRVLASGGAVATATMHTPSIETEMCFTIGRDVERPVAPEAVLEYVSGVSAGFELNEARPGSVRPDFCAMVTDCLTNWGIVFGEPVVPAADALDSTEITMTRNGEQVFHGVSREHVDPHVESLSRLTEVLARHGQMLRAGQRVITGAFARFPVEPGERWHTEFSGIGSATIEFT